MRLSNELLHAVQVAGLILKKALQSLYSLVPLKIYHGFHYELRAFFEVEHSTWEQQIIFLPIHRIAILNWVFSPSFLFHNASHKFLWFNHFEFKHGLSHRSSYWLYFPVKAPERKNSAGSSGATSGLRVVHWRGTRMSGAGRARRSVAFGNYKNAVSKTHTLLGQSNGVGLVALSITQKQSHCIYFWVFIENEHSLRNSFFRPCDIGYHIVSQIRVYLKYIIEKWKKEQIKVTWIYAYTTRCHCAFICNWF